MSVRIFVEEEYVAGWHAEFAGEGPLQCIDEGRIAEGGVNFFWTDSFHGNLERMSS